MTLGKRALILIFPVVLAGYLLAALSVHVAQSRSIRALEHAKLSQRLEHAASVFQNEVRRSRGALNALLSGNALRQYVAETDKKYRANALGVRLQESLTSLSDDPAGFISLAVFNSKLEAEYYFENSWDPFAEIDPAQLDLARQLLNGSKLGDWSYVDSAGDRPRVIYSLFVDPVTFGRPAPSNKANALLMQVAVQPDRFLRLQAPLKREYGAEIVLQPWPLAVTDDLSASVPLGPALHATLTVSDAHFEAQMLRQKVLLALGALAMSLFSIWLIIVLIRRFITGPIATLDTNVMAVMAGAREEIAEVDEAGEIGRLTRNIREMHRQSLQSLQLVQRSSWTDTLTGISNRGRFNMLAAQAVQEAVASGEKCSLLFIDIDNFKFVNDKHGHDVGDELLKTLATRIARDVEEITRRRGQEPAILARLSGDEFAVLLRSQPGDGAVQEICGAILALFSDGFELSGKRYPVTASIGVAACPDDASSVAELISNADAAMYQAKTAGKNRSARFSRALNDKRTRQRQIQDELRSLDPDEQFHLVYMPIVDAGGKVTGCEALLRWHSPVLGHVTPDEFVPIAESSGLFTEDRLVGHRQGDVGLPPTEGAVRPRYGSGDQHFLGRAALEVDQRAFFGLPHAPRPGGAIDRHRAHRNIRRPNQRSIAPEYGRAQEQGLPALDRRLRRRLHIGSADHRLCRRHHQARPGARLQPGRFAIAGGAQSGRRAMPREGDDRGRRRRRYAGKARHADGGGLRSLPGLSDQQAAPARRAGDLGAFPGRARRRQAG